MFEVVSNWCRGGDVQLQNRVVDKPVKCYSESDGDVYMSEITTSQQSLGSTDAHMSSLTDVSTVVLFCNLINNNNNSNNAFIFHIVDKQQLL